MTNRTIRRALLVGTLVLASVPLPLAAQPVAPEFRVNTYTTLDQYQSAVAMDAAGNFVVVWQSEGGDGSGYGIFGQRYDSAGAPRGGEFRVNASTTGNQLWPDVASDSAGNFVVVWEPTTIPHAITGQRYSSSGAPLGGEFRINSYTTAPFAFGTTSISFDPAGNFVVVWVDYEADPSFAGILGRRYSSAGAPLTEAFRVNTTTSHHQRDPSVATDAAGNFVVVWSNAADSGNNIRGQRYASTGAPLGTEFDVTSGTSDREPSVAMEPAGNFVVAYQEFVDLGGGAGTFTHISGRAFNSAGAPLGSAFRISMYTTGGNSEPAIARASTGLFVVAWKGGVYDIFNEEVLARRVTAGGKTQGDFFLANSTTLFSQRDPQVAASPNGSFVIAWSSYLLQDLSEYAIVARRFVSVPFPSGDVNADGKVDVLDVFYLINYLFAAGPAPIGKGDVNGSTATDVVDVFYLISFLFAGGPAPV
jgi:hypothetical protein